jgi:glycosyltransferase involved in cell wall biosynthesis
MTRPTTAASFEPPELPRFSVVIPCHEPPRRFLHDCLQSVIDQTMDGWEAIVVDDASRDLDVEDLIGRMGDSRIHMVRHPQNRGEAASRNTGIRIARGELIAALDADDRLAPDFLRKAGAALDASPRIDWILTDRQLFGASVDVLRYPVPLPLPCPVHFNGQSPGLIRRRLWEDIGGYSEEEVFRSGGADLDFWMSAVEHGVVAGHIAEPLYLWRIHGGSASQNSFRYNNHLIHKSLYRRHRRLFHAFVRRCPQCRGGRSLRDYVAKGYVAAADASLQRGERTRSLYLAIHGLVLDPGQGTMMQFSKALAPSSLLRAVRRRHARASQSRRARHGIR